MRENVLRSKPLILLRANRSLLYKPCSTMAYEEKTVRPMLFRRGQRKEEVRCCTPSLQIARALPAMSPFCCDSRLVISGHLRASKACSKDALSSALRPSRAEKRLSRRREFHMWTGTALYGHDDHARIAAIGSCCMTIARKIVQSA